MIGPPMTVPPDSHALLRRAGLRSTPQRQTVLDLLSGGNHRHLTADDIWRGAATRHPSFNRSTAYRVLEQLCDAGIVQQTRFGDSAHFEIGGRLARQHGFAIRSVDLTVEGECRSCRKAPRG